MRNVPKLRFKEFTDEWKEKKLGEICNICTGKKDTQNKVENGKYPFFVRSQIVERINSYSFDGEAILTAGDGVGVGKVFHYINGKFDYHQRVYKLSDFKDCFGRFIFEKFKKDFTKEVKKYNAKTSVDSVRMEMITNMKIDIPTFREQEKIGNFLSSVDKKISILEEKLNLFKEYKKGIMQKIFKQELRFKDENGNNYPEWEEKRLGEVSDIIMGQSPSSSEYNEEFKGLPLIQGNADCKNRKIYPRMYTTEITKESFPNDIIMTVRAPVGAISFSDIHSCIGRGVCAIRNANKFIYHYLIKLEDSWDKLAQGSTFTAVNSNDIKNLVIKLPCLKEQQKIADFLSAIDDKIENISDNLKNLKEFKKGLLQQMFV